MDPLHHFEVIGEDVLLHGRSIVKNTEAAVKAYHVGNFKQFGVEIGTIMQLALSEEPKMEVAETPKIDKRNMVAEFMQGFLEAMHVGTFNFTNLLICIYEED